MDKPFIYFDHEQKKDMLKFVKENQPEFYEKIQQKIDDSKNQKK